jgi:dienelactone hydrolase
VFSHGIGGSREGYTYLGKYWAANGYASLHLQHAGSDRNLWAGNPLMLVSRLQDAAHESEAKNRAIDVGFALDRLLGSEVAPRIDTARIAAAGHSYGANTTLLAAGAQLRRDGRIVGFGDPRIRAAVIISAPPFHGEPDAQDILRHVQVPTLHITAAADDIRIPGYHSGLQDRVDVYAATGGARKSLAVFKDGSHSIFTDRLGTGGADWNPRVKAATRELALDFLRSVFDGAPAAFETLAARHEPLLQRLEHHH